MASNNPLDPWALPPPLTDRRPGSVPTTTASAHPGPAPLRPPQLQSQAREPGTTADCPDIRPLPGRGRGRALLERLAEIGIPPDYIPQRQPLPGPTTRGHPSFEPEIMSLAERSFDVRVMLGFDVELPRVDQQRRPRVRPILLCRPFLHVPPLRRRGFHARPFPR